MSRIKRFQTNTKKPHLSVIQKSELSEFQAAQLSLDCWEFVGSLLEVSLLDSGNHDKSLTKPWQEVIEPESLRRQPWKRGVSCRQ